MKNYKIKLKNTDQIETVRAGSKLGAMVKYCQKRGFDYRTFSNKLEVLDKTRRDRTDGKIKGLAKEKI
jgi:hypothetical protein